MPLTQEHLLDRIRLKRRLRLWQGIAVVTLCIAILAGFARMNTLIEDDMIARVNIEGVIRDDPLRDEAIQELIFDDSVQAVIVRINSPGGTVVGGEALYKSLRKLASEKPVVAVMGEVAASAGYMAAIAADYVIAREGTITGSIGVIMQTANMTGLLEKIGVEPVIIKSDPLKASPNPLEEPTEEAIEASRAVLLDMYDMFINMVAERRELELDVVRKIADGRVYTGRQALNVQLIDENGGIENALNWLKNNHQVPSELNIIDVRWGEEKIWEHVKGSLFNLFSDSPLISQGIVLDGLVSVWHPNSN